MPLRAIFPDVPIPEIPILEVPILEIPRLAQRLHDLADVRNQCG
jgi:hypothetical protein